MKKEGNGVTVTWAVDMVCRQMSENGERLFGYQVYARVLRILALSGYIGKSGKLGRPLDSTVLRIFRERRKPYGIVFVGDGKYGKIYVD